MSFMREAVMKKLLCMVVAMVITAAGLSLVPTARADEFTQEDLKRWEQELLSVVNEGDKIFHSGTLGGNTVSCDQCHPNATNTHPETYPKFQKQIGKVVTLFEMLNWCIQNPLEGKPLAADDPRMVALQAYITHERRGVKLAPGKH
jgi:thiosulfate dehydrogenase